MYLRYHFFTSGFSFTRKSLIAYYISPAILVFFLHSEAVILQGSCPLKIKWFLSMTSLEEVQNLIAYGILILFFWETVMRLCLIGNFRMYGSGPL